jgi:DNA-binding protein H-NS
MSTDFQIDVRSLTPQQRKELSAQIAEAEAEYEKQNKEKTRRDMLALARERGFNSIEEVLGHGAGSQGRTGRRAAAAIKYRNTADPSQTWAGRGKRPRWFADALAAGATEDSLRV